MNEREIGPSAILTVAFWAALVLWRESVAIHVSELEKRAFKHYEALASEASEPLHPIRWGPRVLVPRLENDQREYAETYVAEGGLVKRTWLAVGDALGRVPALVFHAVFATLAVLFTRRMASYR